MVECMALDINRVRQRLAVQIWRDYQDHINARIKYADPDEDDKRRHEEEAAAVKGPATLFCRLRRKRLAPATDRGYRCGPYPLYL